MSKKNNKTKKHIEYAQKIVLALEDMLENEENDFHIDQRELMKVDNAKEFLKFITDGATGMDALINSLLDHARGSSESNKMEQVDVNKVLNIVEKNLANTICVSVIGFVANNSNVPFFNSSEKERIVTAGIRNKNTHGAKMKKFSNDEKPLSRMLYSPGKTQRNNVLSIKNTKITR